MKRLLSFIVLLIVLCAGWIAWGQFSGPATLHKGGQDTDGCQIVVAADWRGPIRGGPNVRRCDGTATTGGDQVEFQAAIDAAEASGPATGGGEVLVLGTLYVSPKVGETAWAGTGKIDATNTVTAQVWTTGDIGDVEAGQLIRIYDNAGGSDPSSSVYWDDHVATVLTVDAKTDTFTFGPSTSLTYVADNDIKFRRVVPCAVIPPGVSIRGVLPEVSRIKMLNNPPAGEYAILCNEDTTTGAGGHGYQVQNLDIHGTNTANTNSAVTHGLVFNTNADEAIVRDIAIWFCSGSGLIHNDAHGFRFTGTSWVENNEEHGVICNGMHPMIIGPKSSGNARANFLFKKSYQGTLMGRSGTALDNSEGIVLINATYINVVGSSLTMTGASCKAVRLGYQSYNNTVTGNSFLFQTGATMTWLDMDSCSNVVSNNAINVSGVAITTVTGDTGVKEANNIVDNAGVEDRYNYRYTKLTNNTGGTIAKWRLVVRPGVSGDQDEMATTTTVGDKYTIGLTQVANTADAGVGWVQKSGWTTTFPGQKDMTFAVGEFVGTGTVAGEGVVIGTAGNGQGAGYAIGVCYEALAATGAGDPVSLDVLLFDRPVYVP
ncbi:MAG TPA: hypothetical protein VMY37_04280 [Thermoguttaceae bacterium]|nr:hypothetical protein [Thermoguttaceae bacterium]